MFDLLGKMGEVKKKMDEIKSRLDHVLVDAESGDGRVRITATGNRKIKSIKIDEALLSPDNKEELEDLLEVAVNRALEKAEATSEAEMKAAGRDLLPGMPGF